MKETRNEGMRQLVEMAVAFGRSLQSPQTGYLHHFHGQIENGNASLTIPTAENMLFVLALLRSKSVENGLEAKSLLDKLLHFQHSQGNFPLYLHEFPDCKDRFVAAHVSVPLFWILKNFHQVLGSALKKRVEEALGKAIAHSLITLKEKQAPYHLRLKIAASAKACGSLLQQPDIEQEGTRLLEELHLTADPIAWHSPAHLGTMLSSLQMVFPSLEKSPWHLFWKHIENTWHRAACAYIGPSIAEYQIESEPQVTLYDLYLSYFSGQFSVRSLKPQLSHLYGVLVHPCEDVLSIPNFPLAAQGEIQEAKWQFLHNEKMGYSYIEKGHFLNPSIEKGFHLLRFVLGTPRRVHTFVCQGGNAQRTECIPYPDRLDILFYLNESPSVEDREKSRDILFYFDVDAETTIKVDDSSANTFTLNEPVVIKIGTISLRVVFNLEEGEGRFLGHLMRGDRPSQIKIKGHPPNAYDWQLFLRSIHRNVPCKMRVSLSWKEE